MDLISKKLFGTRSDITSLLISIGLSRLALGVILRIAFGKISIGTAVKTSGIT